MVFHLCKAEKLGLLFQLFPGRVIILEKVYDELTVKKSFRSEVENLIQTKLIKLVALPFALLNEYSQLIKEKGKGESACLVYCRHNKHVLASSNRKDIHSYCKDHQIKYITTLDIFFLAISKGLMDIPESNNCIDTIHKKGSKLYCKSMGDYMKKNGIK